MTDYTPLHNTTDKERIWPKPIKPIVHALLGTTRAGEGRPLSVGRPRKIVNHTPLPQNHVTTMRDD